MQGFGELLRNTRESKKIDFEKASRETNISKRYIEALETEQFTLFPGEPYLLGFLRNYADYLELNPNELVSVYKKIRLQQSETPEILLRPRKKLPLLPILLGVAAVIVVVFIVFNFADKQNKKKIAAAKLAANVVAPATYTLTDIPLLATLRNGDTLQITGENTVTDLKVTNTLTVLSIQTPIGEQMIEQGEEVSIDIDGLPGAELTLYASRVSKNDATEGADVRMFVSRQQAKLPNTISSAAEIPAAQAVTGTRRLTIFEGNTAYPVTLSAVFRAPCLFRYRSDKSETIEELFASGETVLIQANNGIRVWISNANAVKMQVIGGGKTVDLEAGRAGQVVVQDIRWVRDEDGKYRLVFIDVE